MKTMHRFALGAVAAAVVLGLAGVPACRRGTGTPLSAPGSVPSEVPS